jgi:hypothetical protein
VEEAFKGGQESKRVVVLLMMMMMMISLLISNLFYRLYFTGVGFITFYVVLYREFIL